MRIDGMCDDNIETGVRLPSRRSITALERGPWLAVECFVRHLDEYRGWIDSQKSCWAQVLHDELRDSAVAAADLEHVSVRHADFPHIARAYRLHGRLGRADAHRSGDDIQHRGRLLLDARE